MTAPTHYEGEWKAEVPGCREALEFLRAAANDPGISIEEFGGIADQMLKAGTMPDRLVAPDGSGYGVRFLLGMGDEEDLRRILREPQTEAKPKPSEEALSEALPHDEDADVDDALGGYMPGMTPGPEDEAWNKALGSLSDAQMEKLADALHQLSLKAKAREEAKRSAAKVTDDERSIEAIRNRMGL